MRSWEVWLNNVGILLASVSGVTYGVMKYVLAGRDPYSRLGHPLQPAFLKWHILVVPIVVFTFGLLVRGHALPRLAAREKRTLGTGGLMLLVFAPLTFSGYAIQAAPDARWIGWGHAALGALFCLYYVGHLLRERALARCKEEPAEPVSPPS